MIRYAKFAVLFSLFGCSSADLSEGRYATSPASNSTNEKSTATADDGQIGPAAAASPSDSQLAPRADETDVSTPEAAITPIAVGGASLTCSLVENAPDEAKCVASRSDGKPLNFKIETAYLMFGGSLSWRLASYRVVAGATDSWILTLPPAARNKSVGIILSDVSKSIMADWIVNDTDKPASLVQDGGFEDHVLDHSTPENLLASQFLTPDRQSAWKVANTSSPNCKPVLEIQSTATTTELSAAEGSQWTELDSSCNANYSIPGNNISAYQDLTLEVGHLYQISFSIKMRTGGVTLEAFTAALGTQTIVNHKVTENDWSAMSFVVTAAEAKSRLAFTETGDAADGRGTLLDNVVVTDLGDSKTVLVGIKDSLEVR